VGALGGGFEGEREGSVGGWICLGQEKRGNAACVEEGRVAKKNQSSNNGAAGQRGKELERHGKSQLSLKKGKRGGGLSSAGNGERWVVPSSANLLHKRGQN